MNGAKHSLNYFHRLIGRSTGTFADTEGKGRVVLQNLQQVCTILSWRGIMDSLPLAFDKKAACFLVGKEQGDIVRMVWFLQVKG